ncbi:hypothetical protein FRB94_002815 [Tulasnella sp. JGI-2019a]|nr:hypothetical protein FRB93_004987 [Tulasnella sp. JGI-2019a]KAG9003898.1 hypothetical protein FRB94_002815 [Tulasnella sp. JGI-2019a]KAG9031867.1 hypothetical protein FRB95_002140 [Tulasnella sp. JGI-2019a]
MRLFDQPHQSLHIFKDPSKKDYVSAMRDGGMQIDVDFIRPARFLHYMHSEGLFPSEPGAMIDMVIFSSCELDLQRHHPELLDTWDGRPDNKKFKLVCVVHDGLPGKWFHTLGHCSRRGALRLLMTLDGTTKDLYAAMRELADSSVLNLSSALFEYLQVEAFYPLIATKRSPPAAHALEPRRISNVAILGNFGRETRHYQNFLRDLGSLLEEYPRRMGYLPFKDLNQTYEPNFNATIDPFKLHLIGSGKVEVSATLREVVRSYEKLEYLDLLRLVESMDMVIPGVTDDARFDSDTTLAIQTVISCRVPVFATHRLRNSYAYIDDDLLVITRPQAVRETDAIFALRTGSTRHIANDFQVREFGTSIQRMVTQGWQRSPAQFEAIQAKVMDYNQYIVYRLLRDLP